MATALGFLAVWLAVLHVGQGLERNRYQKYYIEDFCSKNSSATIFLAENGVYSRTILHATRSNYTLGGKHCSLVIRPPSYHGIILSVENMTFGNYSYVLQKCLDDHMMVVKRRNSVRICGSRKDATLIQEGDMQLIYHTTDFRKARLSVLSLVATVYRKEYEFIPCTENEFRCSRGICISNTLTCDGVNNCGDSSDETMGGNLKCQKAVVSPSTPANLPAAFPTMSGQHVEIDVTIAACVIFFLLLFAFRWLCGTNKSVILTRQPVYKVVCDHSSPPPYSCIPDDDDDLLDINLDQKTKKSMP